MYIEIDVHKSSCYITALNEKGEILRRREVETKNRGWIEEVDRWSKIAMKSGTFSKPLYNELKEMGFKVFMAHPAKLELIAESSKKTNRNDNFHLANLLRMEYLPCS